MSKLGTLAELMVLGANASFDPSQLATSTLQSIISHIRTLKRNGIEINEESLTIDTEYMLDRLRDSKGNLLNDAYKRQIGMTIKRLYPKVDISLDKYKQSHNDARHGKGTTRISSDEFMDSVRTLRDATLNIINDVYLHERIDDLGQYDSSIATLLTLCTSLRIEEIRQLKLSHIEKIRNNQPIGIKSKQSFNTRVISTNNLLEATFLAIEKQRPYVIAYIEMRKTDYATQYHLNRLHDEYIIMSTSDYMRKKLHETAAACGAKFKILGFTVFRKLTTSVLIEGGGFLVAQTMNNHSSLNTTLEHYNMQTSKSIQTTYDSLAIDTLNSIDVPTPTNTENIKRSIQKELKSPIQLPKKPTPQPSTSTPADLEIKRLRNQLQDQSKNLAEILQLKNDIDLLRAQQNETTTKLQNLPQQFDEQLNRVKVEANKKIDMEFQAAQQKSDSTAQQLEVLRESLNSNLMLLQAHGIERSALDELNGLFQDKITEIEKSCVSAKQLKAEYDVKLENIEKFVNKAKTVTSDPVRFKKLEQNLQTTLKNNVDVRTREINRRMTKVSQDIDNLKRLFGIEQQTEQNEIKTLTEKTIIAQTENEQKFQALNSELNSLRRMVLGSRIEERPSTSGTKRRRLQLPYETPPYTPKIDNDDDDDDL
ncbi:vlf-1 [Tomelloso virus]|uniref:Vlf-1 n=1 Tax=Tomelloso virus TaxID=2053981 RepID=A0A2H4T2N1_9VIRU|nr:vlf-1 [Tomelloso virus]ATY70184.1 vlf-1 [Tomelloso virus]